MSLIPIPAHDFYPVRYISMEMVTVIKLMERIPDTKRVSTPIPRKRLERVFRGTSFLTLSEYFQLESLLISQGVNYHEFTQRTLDISSRLAVFNVIISPLPTQDVDRFNWMAMRKVYPLPESSQPAGSNDLLEAFLMALTSGN